MSDKTINPKSSQFAEQEPLRARWISSSRVKVHLATTYSIHIFQVLSSNTTCK